MSGGSHRSTGRKWNAKDYRNMLSTEQAELKDTKNLTSRYEQFFYGLKDSKLRNYSFLFIIFATVLKIGNAFHVSVSICRSSKTKK